MKNEVLKGVDDVVCMDFDSLMHKILGDDYGSVVENGNGFLIILRQFPMNISMIASLLMRLRIMMLIWDFQ